MMGPTFAQTWETLTFRAGYNTNLVLVGTTLLGLAAGVIGVFILLRKRSLVADALAHATLPGIALAFLLATALGRDGRALPVLLGGAAVTGALGVVTIQAIVRSTRLREDAALGAVLSVFFGAGVVLLSWIQRNAAANAGGLGHFIYGQTAAMSAGDALLMAGIALGAVAVTALLFKELALVSFDDSFAQVDGWPVSALDLLVLVILVLVTVAGLQAVGLLLVVALLILPPVAARFWTERLRPLVVISGCIGGVSGYLGSTVSALLPRKPAGAVIVLTAGAIFAVSLLVAPARGLAAAAVRRYRLRLQVARDHVLEAGFEQAMDSRAVPADDALPPVEAPLLDRAAIAALARLRAWKPGFRWLVFATLVRAGEARRAGDGLVLTEKGLREGARVNRNHRLWEQYLISYADVAPSHVDWSVDQVEHVLSEELVAELEAALVARGVNVPAVVDGGMRS